MLTETIQIGESYNVRAVNAGGKYKVIEVRQNGKGDMEVIAKHETENKIRVFTPEQIIEPEAKKSNRQRVIAESLELEYVFDDGVELWSQKVSFWPPYKKRGRPRKVKQDV